ncbi:hypothetical protein DDZ16_16020 [Marinilabilia rubra]|uniref:Uncharacterized protein n=1 Tax=Marinilabilia rubra TaxID=2162893 RepID=A0A2U2B5E4_9BACT|nr:hypothetical protein DDZ16_16020 [Marinilabilia rubra]
MLRNQRRSSGIFIDIFSPGVILVRLMHSCLWGRDKISDAQFYKLTDKESGTRYMIVFLSYIIHTYEEV